MGKNSFAAEVTFNPGEGWLDNMSKSIVVVQLHLLVYSIIIAIQELVSAHYEGIFKLYENAFRNLVPFAQFKQHPWIGVTFSKVAG